MSVPPAIASLAETLGDSLPAIVVKEARQAVRSRAVFAALLLLLAILVAVMGAALLAGTERATGREVFHSVRAILHGVCVLGVPLYVGVRMAAELSDANTDLLFSTTIRPWSVVAGKLASGLMLGLLAASACAPFLALCYFLRGIGLGEIASALREEAQLMMLATMAALFVASLPVGVVAKGAASLAYLVLALGSFRWTAAAFVRGAHGHGFSGAQIAAELFAWLGGVAIFGLFFLMAVAMVSPPSSNRAMPVRLYLTVVWVLSAGVGVLGNFAMVSGTFRPFRIWLVSWSVLLAVATLVAASERDRLGPRVRAQITTLNGKINAAALMLFSGAASGLFWSALMTAATLAFGTIATYSMGWIFTRSSFDISGMRPVVLRLAAANAMTLGYVLLAGCVRRRLWPDAPARANGFVALGLVAAGTFVPTLAAVLLQGTAWRWETACVAFPFTCALARSDDPVPLAMAAVLAAVLLAFGLVWSLPWFAMQLKVFREARPLKVGGVLSKRKTEKGKEAADAAG